MLHWDWKDKVGEATFKNGQKVTLYTGNAWLIALVEYEGTDEYTMSWFFVDKEHMRNCLGLSKGHDENILADLTVLRLSKSAPHFAEIVAAFAKAFDELTIEIQKGGE